MCRQLTDKFHYVPHDEHYRDHVEVLVDLSKRVQRPLITESPFGERVLREKLEAEGLKVFPFFVVEPQAVVSKRYREREGKVLPKAAFTRAATIINRAKEWEAFHGTSQEVLEKLKSVVK